MHFLVTISTVSILSVVWDEVKFYPLSAAEIPMPSYQQVKTSIQPITYKSFHSNVYYYIYNIIITVGNIQIVIRMCLHSPRTSYGLVVHTLFCLLSGLCAQVWLYAVIVPELWSTSKINQPATGGSWQFGNLWPQQTEIVKIWICWLYIPGLNMSFPVSLNICTFLSSFYFAMYYIFFRSSRFLPGDSLDFVWGKL